LAFEEEKSLAAPAMTGSEAFFNKLLEDSACLAKAKCKKCGTDIVILDFNEYVSCDCGELFGDAGPLLAGQFDEINQLEWINKDGYENVLLLERLRRKFPKGSPAK
jgi:hypothetical protein